ncbi:hypothetical protein Patl1_16825 [Pistacia atlantica]|uniref:Uncharacterized protein n=1 Tax=Pistacia atlantica TaxID=434234 RepID=A0ACC1BA35_9ROSI|nr:hypothetical protein Patl1_16825 [Pistacia atlantica]
MGTCAEQGGCPSDYLAIAIAILFFILLLSKSLLPFLVHKVPRIQGSGFWIPLIQVFASFNLLLSLMVGFVFHVDLVNLFYNLIHQNLYMGIFALIFTKLKLCFVQMSATFFKFRGRHSWQFCYVWAVWFEGPLGFGLLLSCRIAQAFQLYYIFVRKRLPPVRSYIFLPLILVPWITGAA